MTLKMFWRILTTPSCWLRFIPHDKRCDELIRYLLDNRDRVTTCFARYEDTEFFYNLRLFIDGNEYNLWIENKWHGYLSHDWGPKEGWIMPSRALCFEFYDTFEKPFREEHGIPVRSYRAKTFIKPEKHDAKKQEA